MNHQISYDKYIIKELTNFFTQSNNINSYLSKLKYRILIIKNAEYLSKHAQSFLRRTMEKYSEYCRFILHTQQLCSLISPIRSRCLPIRIPSINYDDCFKFSRFIIEKEKLNLDDNTLGQLINNNNNSIYDILLIIQSNSINDSNKINCTKNKLSYENKLDEIIDNLFTKNAFGYCLTIKQTIYKQLISNIDSITIIKYLNYNFLKKINSLSHPDETKFKLKLNIIDYISECQSKIITGNKSIFYFELLFLKIAKFLEDYI